MPMKRMLLLLLVCLLALPAAALAQTSGIANQVPALFISDAQGPADALMDDDAATFWSGAIDPDADVPTWTVLTASQTVKEIWIRSGNRQDPWSYVASARPELLSVKVYYQNQQVSTYRYRLEDAYTKENDRNWVDGYQRLLLPQAMNGVFCIEIKVLRATGGLAGQEVALSDILLSSGQPSAPSSGAQMRASAPTVRPDATMPPVAVQTPAPGTTQNPNQQGNTGANPTLPPASGDAVGITATVNKRIATRTGPGTKYDEVGSFFQGGETVQVISKVWDAENELYWLYLDFTSGGVRYRGYAIHQQVNIDPSQVPDEPVGTSATIIERTNNYFGPGSDYKAHTDRIANGTKGNIYAWENGCVLFDWYDSYQNLQRRAWIPESSVTWNGK